MSTKEQTIHDLKLLTETLIDYHRYQCQQPQSKQKKRLNVRNRDILESECNITLCQLLAEQIEWGKPR